MASASTDRPELAGVHLDARGRSGATESRRQVRGLAPAVEEPTAADAKPGAAAADLPEVALQQVPDEHRRRSLSTEGS